MGGCGCGGIQANTDIARISAGAGALLRAGQYQSKETKYKLVVVVVVLGTLHLSG